MSKKGPGGAPKKYDDKYDEQARKLCLLGYTDIELADFFGVCEKTIYNWKDEFPSFLQALKDGKEIADANVAAKLYERATGYSHKETKVLANSADPQAPVMVEVEKHYAPDTTACAVWLNNRRRGNWRSRPEEERVNSAIDQDEKFL